MAEFDWREKADSLECTDELCSCRFKGDIADARDCDLHGLNALPFPDAGDIHAAPDPCPVRHHIFQYAKTVGEMMDALKLHQLEYCETCGQFEGFVRPDFRRAA